MAKEENQLEKYLPRIQQGIRCCRQGEWAQGMKILGEIAEARPKPTRLPSLFYSYLGNAIARCDKRYREGLSLCRHATRLAPNEPENWANLAIVLTYTRNRKGAYEALRRGFRLDGKNPYVWRAHKEMGVRQRPVVPFLPRSFPLNRWLGERRHDRLSGFAGNGA